MFDLDTKFDGILLRKFQCDALNATLSSIKTKNKANILMPIGTGKTIICLSIIKNMIKNNMGTKFVIIVDRVEICEQISNRIKHSEELSVYLSESHSVESDLTNNVEVLTIQKLSRNDDYATSVMNSIDTVILFDVNYNYSNTKKLLSRFDKKIIIGISNYIQSEESSSLDQNINPLFNEIDFKYSYHDAVIDGYFNDYTVVERVIYDLENHNNSLNTKLLEYLSKFLKTDYIKDVEVFENILKTKINADKDKDKLLDALNKNINTSLNINWIKSELDEFERLLYDNEYFNMISKQDKGPERVWQRFFEKNQWLFGAGLSLVCTESVIENKLEQIIQGPNFNMNGSRIDALLNKKGIINSLVLVEIKTHRTQLLHREKYRNSWRISDELSGAIAQAQNYVQTALNHFRIRTDLTDKDGNPIGKSVYLVQPKAYIVIGTLSEFSVGNEINEEKFASFELFRRQLVNPEIITFDELYNRLKYIAELKMIEE